MSIFLLLSVLAIDNTLAQDAPQPPSIGTLQCGDIVEGEIIPGQSQQIKDIGSTDGYALQVPAGTHIDLTVEPLGDTFNVAFVLLDAAGNDILRVNSGVTGQAEQLLDFPLGSSRQILRIFGMIPDSTRSDNFFYYHGGAGQYFGAYRISLGCDGKEPGDNFSPASNTSIGNGSNVIFSGNGFPGLPPVDFANAFRLPLVLGTPTEGEIPPGGDAVLGFRFQGDAGDTASLSFARVSGNLSLGIVVLSADNQVAYMAALVSAQTMSAQFTLPSTGEYTIGIFRIDLIPPAVPEATDFSITVRLN